MLTLHFQVKDGSLMNDVGSSMSGFASKVSSFFFNTLIVGSLNRFVSGFSLEWVG